MVYCWHTRSYIRCKKTRQIPKTSVIRSWPRIISDHVHLQRESRFKGRNLMGSVFILSQLAYDFKWSCQKRRFISSYVSRLIDCEQRHNEQEKNGFYSAWCHFLRDLGEYCYFNEKIPILLTRWFNDRYLKLLSVCDDSSVLWCYKTSAGGSSICCDKNSRHFCS